MIYLDYSATTPVNPEVLESIIKATNEYIGNANSLHELGIKSAHLIEGATKQICDLFRINQKEIIYTSGATESNNLAIKGVALEYANRGKHIIISKLEHPSVYAVCDYLETLGYQVSRVKNDEEGLIDIEHLKSLIKKDTILISICAVNSELGIKQPLKTLKQIIKKCNPNTILHSDMTQGIGKIRMDLHDVDLASMSAHKFFGPKGIGILYKNESINLTPVIHGSGKSNELRPGTPALPLIVAMSKALRISLADLDSKETFVKSLNDVVVEHLQTFSDIQINKTKYSIPHILNITIPGIRPETFIRAMSNYEVYIGTNTACNKGDISESVMAIYNDHKRALSTIRISLSYYTVNNEVSHFLEIFNKVYKELNFDKDIESNN